MLTRRDFIKLGGVGVAAAVLAGCGSKGKENLVPAAELPSLTPAPDYIATITPIGTIIPVAMASPFYTETLMPTPTETALRQEKNWLRNFLTGNWNEQKTHYLGGSNRIVDENTGESVVNLENFETYFIARQDLATESLPVYLADKAFAQLSQPIKDLSDRAPDFDKRNNGQGLGFTQEDLPVLMTYEDVVVKEASGNIISNERDGYDRAWILAKAHQADRSVLAIVDNWLRQQGADPVAEVVQGLRRETFERIMYSDLGVMPTGDGGDGEWWTVTSNGRFDIACSTYTADADTRSQQPEMTRLLSFYPFQEDLTNQIEDEKETVLDADDSVLVVGVTGQDNYLRVEVYTLCNTPDSSNSSMDKPYGIELSAAFYRWLPCGVGSSQSGQSGGQPTGQPGQLGQPEKSEPPEHNPEGDPSTEPNPQGGDNSSEANDDVVAPPEE